MWIHRIVVGALATVTIYLATTAFLVAFGTSDPPPVSRLIDAPFATIDTAGIPSIQRYRSRDGVDLAYREYPNETPSQFAVLIHGSSGTSAGMHLVATLLQSHGYAVFVPDLRGHGANRPHGDLVYVGQLDDVMEDFLATVTKGRAARHGTLVGFSSGGGFALRIAAEERIVKYFQRVVLVAPYLRYDAPSVRRELQTGPAGAAATPWAVAYVGRIIGLTMLNRLGVHAFDGLPVLIFAVPADSSATRTYSWRMQQNFGSHDDYGSDIAALPGSTAVLVGIDDSLLVPAALRVEFQSRRPGIAVYCVPGVGHSELITDPNGLGAILGVITGQRTSE